LLDIRKAVHTYLPKLVDTLPTPLLNLFISFLQKLFHEKFFLKIYAKNHYLQGLDFVDSMLENLKIDYTVKASELKNIPSTGKVIIIANHATGAQDTLSLVQMVANVRENKKVKFLSVPIGSGIKQIESLLIPVDNVNGSISKSSLKETYKILEEDEALIIFPAGIVSRFTWKGIKDSTWKSSFLKIAQRSKTPILPIKIEARNSILFYTLSLILPNKLTAMLLPHEFATASKKKTLHFNIGKVIPLSSFNDKNISVQTYVQRFYKHIYQLNTKHAALFQTEVTITKPQNRQKLKEEVDEAQFLGYTNNKKRIILVEAKDAPFLIHELGRVRELSFRAIGGGTASEADNDLYDNHYQHLVLWDEKDLEIVGAYRLGECHRIIPEKGLEGMYTSNLCHFSDDFSKYCKNSVELGRSFVQPKYWGSRAFDSLWQAVTVYLAHNPHIQYSYGVITINADTPQKAVAALVYFYNYHFACPSKMMTAKSPYIMSESHKKEFKALFADLNYKEGFVVLKRYLKDMGTTVPTLFKQYVELYEPGAVRYFDFSVNEGLFGVTEGFIIADNYRMKKSVQKRNLKNFHQNQNIDPLTGLYSRNYFDTHLEDMAKYKRKHDSDYLLCIITIDNFEQIVKEFGFHSNDALKKVAQTLRKYLRADDIIAKYENESFVVLIQEAEEESENIILEKLRLALEKLSVKGLFKISATVSATQYKHKTHGNILEALSKVNTTLTQANNVRMDTPLVG